MPQVLFYHFPSSPGELRIIDDLVRDFAQKGITSYVCLWRPHENHFTAPTGLSGFYSLKQREWPTVDQITYEWDHLEWREAMFNCPNLSAPHEQLLRRARNVSAFQSWLLDVINPQLIIMWNGERTHHFLLRQLLPERHSTCVRLERAPFPGLIYLSRDGLMADSKMAIDEMTWDTEMDHEQWRQRFRKFKSQAVLQSNTWWEQGAQTGNLRGALGIPEKNRVALFASQVDSDTQNHLFSSFKGNVDAFRAFCRLCDGEQGLFILGKHHPKSDIPPDDFRAILAAFPSVKGAWLSEGNISECLSIADAVAAVNSSVLFEAALRDLPCLAMGRHLFSHRGVFYDLKSETDKVTIKQWLSDSRKDSRNRAFETTCSWLLAHHMYSLHDNELRSCKDLADELIQDVFSNDSGATASLSPEMVRRKTRRFFTPRLRARVMRAIRVMVRRLIPSRTSA